MNDTTRSLQRKGKSSNADGIRVVRSICTVLVFLVFSGCYTLEKTTVVSKERITGTEEKTGIKKYTYETTQNPSVDKPEVQLKIQTKDQYKVGTRTKFRHDKRKVPGSGVMITTGILLTISGFIISGTSEAGSAGNYIGGAMVGVGIPLGTAAGIVHGQPNYKSKYFYKSTGNEYFYNISPLSNSNVLISSLNKSRMFQTDNNGSLRFNLVDDFNITTSTDNSPITFNLKANNTDFDRPLRLKPSLWMNKYAKITSQECDIKLNKNSYSNILGIARKGMEYKILSEGDALFGNYKISKYKIELFNKSGWIDALCAETFYSVPKEQDISMVLKNYRDGKITKWQKRSEFELKEDYAKRIMKREQKANEFWNEAKELYQRDYIALIEWDKATLSRYDADNFTFKVGIPGLDSIVIYVPHDIAPAFKNNWDEKKFQNQQFEVIGGKWMLSSLEIKNQAVNYIVQYTGGGYYDPTTEFPLPPLPEPPIPLPPEPPFTDKSDLDAGYDIHNDLPVTKMSDPNAIAVVIGNANYSHPTIDPVNFAINDASSIKTYLIKVLGFKPANIVFKINATKGELENLFGTKSNHKGRLYDLVKQGVSDVFVFYSGHGAPGIDDKEPYLVPSDCDPMRVDLGGYPLQVFYENLAKIPAKSTTVILDACFSGAGVLKNISSVVIAPKDITMPMENSVIMTSSTGKEVSSWFNAKQHGLFTYFFLKAIHDHANSDKNHDNDLTFQEIYDYISDKTDGVPYYGRRLHGVEQTPTIRGNAKERVFVAY